MIGLPSFGTFLRPAVAAALLIAVAAPGASRAQQKPKDSGAERERALQERIEKLERRLAEMEARLNNAVPGAAPATRTGQQVAVPRPSEAPASAEIDLPAATGFGLPAQGFPEAGTPPSQLAKPEKKKAAEPFAFADFTWLTGNPRTKESPLDTKAITGEFRADMDYVHDFNHPKDNTIGGSSEVFRSGEVQLTQLGIGRRLPLQQRARAPDDPVWDVFPDDAAE